MGVYGAVFHYHKISRNVNSVPLVQWQFYRQDSWVSAKTQQNQPQIHNVMDSAGICILKPVQNGPCWGAEMFRSQPPGGDSAASPAL